MDDYIQGAALVGMAISQGLLSILRSKGILTDAEANEFLDHVLTGLEQTFSSDEPAVRRARQIVETILRSRGHS
jgi:hypothetical protein